ncbi:flagellar assembly protein T N-terminal domain-containing protein [Paragemmobacter straminiformis]|uniref:Flagellar assembly protein T N-terminal domain-containing protein n=1 Tax=Paragemmobacter straminiformis TaxID=2045119 RepID=A0A842I3S2_9RHOB|nr:flagellar assembly protein T N-terminal domain-containing protein [Gemmobacter straminiformis]MBC2834802.1 flagellar assembly protein T N-terminal domain-containing protein [Gemmobacter straminiformis]
MLRLLVALVLLAAAPLRAEDLWIEAKGFAVQSGAEDAASAKRRAVADALLMAALSGGADVRAHTAVDRSVVTSDLLIVRPVGRVKEHRLISATRNGDTWEVVLQARVGLGPDAACDARRKLVITAFAPEIEVSPYAPAWAAPLAQEVANDLVRQVERHPSVELVRVTDRAMTRADARRETVDYMVLTKGSVRLGPGEHGFVPAIRLDMGGSGRRPELRLSLEMRLVGGSGEETRQAVERSVALPGVSPLGRLAVLVEPDRRQMAGKLTAGLDRAMTALLDVETCKPVLAYMAVSGHEISAPVGRRQGLTKGAIAFTADADGSTEMLEVVALGAEGVTLRPLDPNRPAKAFAGRPVRFFETGV